VYVCRPSGIWLLSPGGSTGHPTAPGEPAQPGLGR
jgi:hypothetical protein